MPELPEVETIRRGLQTRLVGRTVTAVEWGGVALRRPSPLPLGHLQGRRFRTAGRHGKYLILGLDDRSTFLAHLGMTGKFLFAKPHDRRASHTHLILDLDDGRQLRFSDPRRFGMLRLHRDGENGDLDHYGIDALDPMFTEDYLEAELAASRAPLKAFLLDQTKVAGIGNIYACEALWRAGLSPRRKAQNTPRNRVTALHEGILSVLHDSLAQGGTSFNDYVNSIGEPGKFLLDLAVFQRNGQPCPRCGADVRRLVQSNRSSFYCPGCQR